MKIFLKNNLTGKKEVFKPITEKKVRMYHCGPTVYDRQHLGNLSSFIVSDVLNRLFTYQNFEVTQVINITDVGHLTSDSDSGQDKVEKTAREKNLKATDITQKYTDIFLKDLKKLNIDTEKIIFPKATDHIKEQIELIKKLEDKGYTYKIADGIYFNTGKFPNYGKLGSIELAGLQEGARVQKIEGKKNPTDFALWKFSILAESRQQEWDSPWGVGFPGWHLECSAMSQKYLGETFDIHLGGIEHMSIHHNNEIAQSESVSGKPLANYWLHINHLMFEGQKLSKSTGHVIYTDDLEKHNLDFSTFRYWLLTSNYDSEKNLTWQALEGAQTAKEKINKIIQEGFAKQPKSFLKIFSPKTCPIHFPNILKLLNDGLNTPAAIAAMWEMLKDDRVHPFVKAKTVLEMDKIMGVGFSQTIDNQEQKQIPEEVISLAEKRQEARKDKNWATSDKLRQEIESLGYYIKDTENGYKLEGK